MKFDLKRIQEFVSQVPDIIYTGQQIISSVQSMAVTFRSKNETNKLPLLSDTKEDMQTEFNQGQEEFQSSEHERSEPFELAIAGIGYLKVPGDVTAMIGEMARQANETMRFCEEQETIRTEIRANAEVEITRINTMADMVRDYLKRSFDERAGLFDNYFSVLDKALEKGDNTLVVQTLQSINSLAASSPFKDLADLGKVSNMLAEGGEWDI